ncbi:MAG: tRNA (guanine-N7)-methyltransferase [Bacteroidota bacterium]
MLLHPAHYPWPAPPEALFDRLGPLVLEIGFGDGRFLAMLRDAHPGWNLIGAEISSAAVFRAYRRMQREAVDRVWLYKGEGPFVVQHLVPRRALHRIYVNFPDPWPRKRHADRRLMRQPFLRLAATRLAEGGTVMLTTDHSDYFQMAVAEGHATGLYEVSQGAPPPLTLRTKYALKWQDQGKPIYHVTLTKRAEPEETFPVRPRVDLAMQQARLRGALPVLTAFEKLVHRFEGGTAVFRHAYRPLDQPGLILTAQIDEGDLIQDLLLEIRPDAGAETVHLGIKRFGEVMPTKGVAEAVRFVAHWLETQGLELEDGWY